MLCVRQKWKSIHKAFLLYTGCLKEMQFKLLFEFKSIFS